MTKVCTKCDLTLSLECFNRDKTKTDGLYSSCRECSKQVGRSDNHIRAVRNWKKKNPSALKEYEYERYWKDVPAQRQRAFKSLLNVKYNITPEQYFEATRVQENCCAICKTPDSRLTKRLAVDHSDIDGHIRGLLCVNCNVGLGNFRHSTFLMRRAMLYLEQA